MADYKKSESISALSADNFVTVCAWSNTVKHEGEWMMFEEYLERRFGLVATHGMSPKALEKLKGEDQAPAASTLTDPKRVAAVKALGLLDTLPASGFDRITRLGAAVLKVPTTFISLVEENRDFYLSQFGFGEPLASSRQLMGRTFCHLAIQEERPLIIPDTRADPAYAKIPTVDSLGVAAYLGVPLILPSGQVIGAFCAIDFVPHAWSETQVRAATDLASLVVSEIELRLAAVDFQLRLKLA